jgi:hypothetical protein
MDEHLRFRAWNAGKMIYFDAGYIGYMQEGDAGRAGLFFPMTSEKFSMANMEIMQCTGLEDKNGQLIYEGDIIDNTIGDGAHMDKYEVVTYHGGGFSPFAIPEWECTIDPKRIEVVGNIHETRELLKGGDGE